MTSTTGEPTRGAFVGWAAATKRALDRPLASYYLLMGASTLLLTIGLMMVLSASSVQSYEEYDNSYHYFIKQMIWVGLGLPAAFVASRMPTRVIRRFAWVGLIAALALIIATLTPLGYAVHGNRNWLAVGPLAVQPSEIAKLAVVLWAADLYARKESLLDDWKHALIPVVPVIGLITGLVVVMQHDLGTALVLFAIMLGMIWVVGAPGRLFALSIAIVGVLTLFLVSTNPERRDRLMNFADPFKDFQGAGWQPAHGLFAMSSGGWFGKGISASQQKWGGLPEAHTDFIFAVLGEELGLVGTVLVLVLFLTIAYAAIRLAVTTADPFVRYMSAGVTIWLLGQMMINIGMVLALLPVIGIPLPLVSYGGSALLPSLVALGLLIGFARREPEAAAAIRENRRRRAAGVNARASRGA